MTNYDMGEPAATPSGVHQRQCYACGHLDWYAYNTLPGCQCHRCESADTRRKPPKHERDEITDDDWKDILELCDGNSANKLDRVRELCQRYCSPGSNVGAHDLASKVLAIIEGDK